LISGEEEGGTQHNESIAGYLSFPEKAGFSRTSPGISGEEEGGAQHNYSNQLQET
jgi:hypothetical protein